MTGGPRDPDGGRSSRPGPRPRAQSGLLALPGGSGGAGGRGGGGLGPRSPERRAQQAGRAAGRMQTRRWRAEEGGPGRGRGGRAFAGRVRGADGGPREDGGAGDAGGAACDGARTGGRRLTFLRGLFQNYAPRFGEITSVVRVTRSTLQREGDGQRQKLAVPVDTWLVLSSPHFLVFFCQVGLFLSHFNRLVVAGSDIRRLYSVSLRLIYSRVLPFPPEVVAESNGLGKHELLQMKAVFFGAASPIEQPCLAS